MAFPNNDPKNYFILDGRSINLTGKNKNKKNKKKEV